MVPASRPARAGAAVLVLVGVALAGCGGDPAAAPAAPPEKVTVRDVSGEVTVPVTTRDIHAMDEFAALQLLAVGVTVRSTATFFQDPAAAGILRQAGVELLADPSVEAVLARRPALVVGTGHPSHQEVRPKIAPVVPVVLPDFTEGWDKQLAVLAQVTGRQADGERIVRRVDERLRRLVSDADAAGLAGKTISIMAGYSDGSFFAFGPTTLAGRFAAAVKLLRPPAQRGEDNFGFIPISAELLPEQEGDFFVSLVGVNTAGKSVADNKLLDLRRSKVGVVDAAAWAVATPLSAWWILGDLEAILLGRGTPAKADQAAAIWADLLGR